MTEVMLLKLISVAAICIIVCVAALVAGLGDAHVAGKAVDGIARQPEAKASIFSTMLIGIGLVEATPIIALVVALILLYANPFLG
ncbi:MAG TPA: ATP synthase F0 subunit C [Firmicutes bacterium]|nr:ATP synthase F0 subunit C [Bacillota bacterium]